MKIESVCPNCHAEGVIVGGCLDVLPTTVICGACQKFYRHAATALERIIADDVTDPGKPFYLKVSQRSQTDRKAPASPVESQEATPELQLLTYLKKFSTKRLLNLLKMARSGRWPYPYLDFGSYSEVELKTGLKTELATREHVPRKRR